MLAEIEKHLKELDPAIHEGVTFSIAEVAKMGELLKDRERLLKIEEKYRILKSLARPE